MARRATKKKRGGTVYSVPPLFFKQLSLDTDNIVVPIDIYPKETELLALAHYRGCVGGDTFRL